MKGVFIPMEPGTGERARVRLEQLDLGRYVGGQGEIHLDGGLLNGGQVFRGDIAAIAIAGDDLEIEFAWLGVTEKPGVWTEDPDRTLRFGVPLIASSEEDGLGRVILQAPIIDQVIVLFPPGYTVDGEPRRLDRSVLAPRRS
jgi:hypothetical protein